ncbi:MAG: carboxypeptidase regulatory-like domain-containing protein, partial [Candidatus Cloacimonas sp.]|nr:carboxypeptidase regulatory-like domain-containing protein [Candidatus Cloacimonas sp.]
MKRSLIAMLIIALFALWALPGFTQTMEYAFSATQDTYTPITGGLLLGTETSDDQRFLDPAAPVGASTTTGPGLDIGFSFTFNGAAFDKLAINNNGWLSLGQSTLTPSVNNSSTSGYTPIQSVVAITPDVLYNRIAGLARDLQAQVGATLRLETIGTAPNRICVVQWANYKKYGTAGTGDNLNFQIQLHETTNNVKIVYGQMLSNATVGNMQVGLRGPLATDFNSRQGTGSWTETTAASLNTEYVTLSDVIFPANGLTFNFNYPVANQAPNPANLVSPANAAILVNPSATLNWVSGGNLPTGYRLNLGTNNPPTNLVDNLDLGALTSYDPNPDLTLNTTFYWQVIPYNSFGSATNCPVWSFTTHGDPTVSTLPYNQSWDLVTVPDLPFDWTSIVQSTVTTSYVKTVITSPNTAPNCVGIYNGADTAANVLLVGPPIAPGISMNAIRVKFWGKGSAAYHVLVGVMTNPADPATFESIQDVNTIANWNEYIVSLAGYTGAGRYIAIKHACAASSQTIYIDGVSFDPIAANDLEATSLTGNATPSVDTLSNYTVSLYNWGTANQNAYTVKLMSGTTELASVPGPTIAPAGTASAVISWTPTVEGPISLYGKVVLTGDVNATNDETPVVNISVQPAGAVVVTVGDGSGVEGVPLDFYYKNSLHQALYYPNEIGVFGAITALTFYNNFVSNLENKPVKFWLGSTDLPDLSGGWILPDQLTLVYDGTINLPSGENDIVIPLQTPFIYTGGNLVLYANRPIDTVYFNTNDNFKTQTIGTNRGRKLVSDTVTYDPAAPSAVGTLSGLFAKTTFTFVVDNMGSLSGTITSGGNPVEGVLIQIAGNTQTQITSITGQYSFPFLVVGNYSITATKLGYNTQTLPATIAEDQNTVLNFNLVPSNTVSVNGFVVGSDAPTVGLAAATVHLDGPLDYDGTADATGHFTITGVLSGNTYNYTIVKVGYADLTGSITLAASSYNMGTLVMNEVALPPVHVVATENDPHTQVSLTWSAPGSTGGGGVEDFEVSDGGWVPTSNWTNPLGDWQWANTYDVTNYVVGGYPTSEFPPLLAHSGTGLWGTILYAPYSMSGGFNYLTKTFNFSGNSNPQMKFWSWNNSFGNFDYGQIAVNGTIVWGPAWDTNPIEWEEIIIDLSAYANLSEVTIQFQQYATTVVSYAGWYIDDVYVGTAQTMARSYPQSVVPEFLRGLTETDAAALAENMNRNYPRQELNVAAANSSRNNRVLNGYQVWRLLQGNEANETTWTPLTAITITDTTYTDTAWSTMPDGNYRWAVKGIYTNNMQGPVAFSNMVRILRNDLAATSLTGNTTPTAGTPTTYTVEIKNTGTLAKAAGSYTVKLMSGTTELASVSGPAIAPAEELNVTLSWTPTTAGPLALTGKVVLTADTVPANDISPVLSITVMPTGVVAITIGDGSQTEGKPVDFYYKNSLFECLYFPSEMGLYGTVTAISFYNTFITDLPNKPTKIWLGTTDLNDLSGGWILPPQLTLVYDGNISYPAGENTVTIPLQTQFQYLSGNLVLYANRPMDTVSYNTNDNFLTQTIGTTRSRKLVSDTVTYDPNAPSAVGTLAGSFPKTTFHLTAGGPNPIFSINPSSKNWGTVLINSENNQSFSIANAGNGTLTISNISISGSPMFSLQNLPTLPANMTFGQTATFVARYMPTAVGNHTATITITDNMARSYTINVSSNNGSRLAHPVALSGTCIDTTLNTLPYAQAFDAVTIPDLPPDWSFIYQATVTTGYVKTVTTTPNSAPNCAAMYNPTDANTTAMLIAPPLGTTIPTNTTWVKFWARSSGANYQLSVGVMVNNTDPLTYTETEMISLTTTWTQYVVAFSGYTGAGKLITFKHGLGGTARTLYIDDVMIEVVPTNDLAALALSGNASPTVGTAAQYNVVVKNWGTAAQNTYTVKLYNAAGTELATAAGLPCAPGATINVPLNWTPATEGAVVLHAKVILTGDQNDLNDQTPNLTVLVLPIGVWAITVGSGDQFARVPLDFYYKNSIYEGLYYPAEMGNFIGQITGLQFYNNFVTNLPTMPTKVWIGTTTLTSLTDGWIPPANLTLVFDGTIDYPSGDNLITIPFNQNYLYLNGENLVLFFNRPMDTAFYNTSDDFQAQTDAVNTTRSRKLSSDSVTYDLNALPTTGTVSGQFPKTTLLVIPGGVGHINGTVLGVENVPLEGVTVAIPNTTYTATTNAQGQYEIRNIQPATYDLSFTKYGYITHNQAFTLLEDQTLTVNVTMLPMPTVNITGTILASDTGNGISGAAITLTGYQNYSANTNATGAFTVANVYANETYNYSIISPGYTSTTGTINVGATSYSMGNITLSEVAYAPFGVLAEVNDTYSAVNLAWQAPDPTAVDVTESFESVAFPPTGWTQTINNTGAQVIPGVFPTWCRFASASSGGTPINPPDGSYQAGLWWDYSHQDEWLVTPSFNCPPSAHLSIQAYIFLGSENGDHYYIKVSTDGGSNWTVLYDASAQLGGLNYYSSPVVLDLEMYGGQQIKIAFHAEDPATNDGLWYAWFIDNL